MTPKLGTVEFRNYSEITPILLRNWGTVEFRNYSETWDRDRDRGTSEITPKLWTGTVVLRNYSENYSEITPKLWLAIVLY